MENKNIIKPNDKYTLLGFKGAIELTKVNTNFIKQNTKYF